MASFWRPIFNPTSGAPSRLATILPIALGVFLLISYFWIYRAALAAAGPELVGTSPANGRWTVLDWLINYEGGFVRRGLLGEAILTASDTLGVGPERIVLLLTLICYFVFFASVYLMVLAVPDAGQIYLLLFSPFFLPYEAILPSEVGRKDILLLILLAVLCLCRVRAEKKGTVSHATEIALAMLVPLILCHEAFFLYSPYVLIIAHLEHPSTARLGRIYFLWSLSGIAFFCAIASHGSAANVAAICESLAVRIPATDVGRLCMTDGSIAQLGMNLNDGMRHAQSEIASHHLGIWLIPAIGLIAIAFLPLAQLFDYLWHHDRRALIILLTGALTSVLLTLPLFVLTDDWGRWVRIHASAMGLLLISIMTQARQQYSASPRWAKRAYALLVLPYGFGWALGNSEALISNGLGVGVWTLLHADTVSSPS